MGEAIIDPSSPVSHELLVIEPYQAKMENCDVKEDTGQMSVGVEIHSLTTVVLPKSSGAESRVNFPLRPTSRLSSKCRRCTRFG